MVTYTRTGRLTARDAAGNVIDLPSRASSVFGPYAVS